jgi:type II secretory pathway pseudopilin PulG
MDMTERGFTLIETTIGAAIAAMVILGLVVLADRYAAAASALNARLTAQASADRLFERLSSEAASAWAVFVPASDVLGNANADGHELDFFSEDGSHRPYAWAYLYDPTSKTLTRYAYAPGAAPGAGEPAGAFDAFSVSSEDVSALSDPSGAAYDPLFAASSAPPVHYAFAAMPSAQAGNGLVRIHVTASGVDRTEVLASGTAPTAFTVMIAYTPSPPPPATPTPSPAVLTP